MRALFVTTETNEIPKYVESFKFNGNEVDTIRFIHNSRQRDVLVPPDKDIIDYATDYKPDVIVYVGACSGNIPTIDTFVHLKKHIAPTVIIVSDAADVPWWNVLNEYDAADAFNVMVAIDGNKDWPFHDKHITCLTPIPDKLYKPKPHKERTTHFGFAGNLGGSIRDEKGRVVGRRPLIAQMIQFGLKCRERDRTTSFGRDTYQEVVDYMCNTRIIPNYPMTGSYVRMHVKGRVLETGLAGAMLLEQRGSPTPEWFEPGVDYMEWGSIAEAKDIVKNMRIDETQTIGSRLREKVLANHSPEKFWSRVMERL